jgi:hypothetical protein
MSSREEDWLAGHFAGQVSMNHVSLGPSHGSPVRTGYNPQNLGFNNATGQPFHVRMYPPRGELIRHREHNLHQPHFDPSLDVMAQQNSDQSRAWGTMNPDCKLPLGIPTGYCHGIVNVDNQLHPPRTHHSTHSLYCQSPDNTTARLFHRIRSADGGDLATPLTFDDKHIYVPRSLHQTIMTNKRPGEPLAAKLQPATKHHRQNSPQTLTEKSNKDTIDLTGGEDTVQQPVPCTTGSARPDVQAGRMEYVDGDWKRKEIGAIPASKLTTPMPMPTAHSEAAINDKNVDHPHADAQKGDMDIDHHMSSSDDDLLFPPFNSSGIDDFLAKAAHRKPIFEESDYSDVVSNKATTPQPDDNAKENDAGKPSNGKADKTVSDDGLDYLFEDDSKTDVAEPPQPIVKSSKSPDKKAKTVPRDNSKKLPYKYRIVQPNPNTMMRIFGGVQVSNKMNDKTPSSSIPPVVSATDHNSTGNKTDLAGCQPTPSEESEGGNATALHVTGQRNQSAKAQTSIFQKVMAEVEKHPADRNIRSSPVLNTLIPSKSEVGQKPTKKDTPSVTESDADIRLAHDHEKKVAQELAKQKKKNEMLAASVRRTAALDAEIEALKSDTTRNTSMANREDQTTSAGSRAKTRLADLKRRQKEEEEAARQAAINKFHPEIPRNRIRSFMHNSPFAGLPVKQYIQVLKDDEKERKAAAKATEKEEKAAAKAAEKAEKDAAKAREKEEKAAAKAAEKEKKAAQMAAKKANKGKPTSQKSPQAEASKQRRGTSRKVIGNQANPIECGKEIGTRRNTRSKVGAKSAPVTPNQKNDDAPVLATKAASAPTTSTRIYDNNQQAIQTPSKPADAPDAPPKPDAISPIQLKPVTAADTPPKPVEIADTPQSIDQPTSQVSDVALARSENNIIVDEEMSEHESSEAESSESHPTTGGKSIAKLQELFENIHESNQEVADVEMTDEDTEIQAQAHVTKELHRMQREASPITDNDHVYYIYQVKRKEYPKGESEDKSEWAIVGNLMYTSLQEANNAAHKELAYTSHHILTGQIRQHTCHLDEYDMIHYRVETCDKIILVRVDRSLRSYGLADPPSSKAGWLKKNVYAAFKDVIEIIRDDDGTEKDGPGEPTILGLYTHLEQANKEITEMALDVFAPAGSRRIDDISKRRSKELELKELMKELTENDRPYIDEMRLSDDKKVQFCVMKTRLIGPRNI